jgi:CHAT domain-containing protein/tetratricopeptide (TPR) repeat protein
MKMARLSSTLALYLCVVSGAVADQPPAAPLRELSKVDAEWVTKKYDEALVFGRAGKWGHDEAQAPVREILARCRSVLGEDHYMTRYYVREIAELRRLTTLAVGARNAFITTYALADKAQKLRDKDDYAGAAAPAGQILDVYRRVLEPESFYIAMAANSYGQCLYHAGNYDEANIQLRVALKGYRAVEGDRHPGVAQVVGYLALTLERQGHDAEAGPLYDEALVLSIRLLGGRHSATGVAHNNLAGHLDRLARFRDAGAHHRKAVDIHRAGGDETQKLLATSLNNLALHLSHQAHYEEAEDLFQEAIAIRRRLGQEGHQDTGRVYMNLASNRQARGFVVAAEPLFQKAVDAYRAGYGPGHIETAWALINLAVNLDNQARAVEAERLLRDARAIILQAPGDQRRALGIVTNNLASCLRNQDKLPEAQRLSEEALQLLRGRLPTDHPDVAAASNNLAATLEDQDRHADAERHLRDALAIMIKRLGPDHPDTSLGRTNLAVNLYGQGKFDEAAGFLRDALSAFRRWPGERHPNTAWAYKNVVGNACARGDYAGVAAIAAAATSSFEAARLRLGLAGLDRARRTDDISPLPALAVAAARDHRWEAAWDALERNLARGLLDDLAARRLPDEDRQKERTLLEAVDLLDQKVDSIRALGADADSDRHKVEADRETAEAALVRFRAELTDRYGVPAGKVFGLDAIRRQLPEDAALVAWIDLPAAPGLADPKGDHWACVVRRHGEPVWVQLGGTGAGDAWTDSDDRLAGRTRRAIANRPADGGGGWKELATQLVEQRLGPLEPYLKATADGPAVRHLIILPSSRMSALPVDALPGVADRFTVSYAPSGTMFTWLQEQRVGAADTAPRLLGLGDPAFRSAQQPGSSSPDRRAAFAPLPGTNVELLGVGRVFQTKRLLTGSEASEQDLNQLATAGRLRDYRYLHFATHGVLDVDQPMHSALILAQDRLPPDGIDGNRLVDGRLTAERILRHWQLDADLVTLSACNSGLGKVSGGEGYLGFSQALFLAGARSLVLSLWEVDDASTALLMTRFYENLFGRNGSPPMPKAKALTEAKLWLRGLEASEVEQLTKDLATRGTRGRIAPRQPAGPVKAVRTFEHPYYWSGFILVGDPK